MDTSPATEIPATPDSTEPAAAPPRFAALRARLETLQARARALPAEARVRALAVVARVRIALDLPSRTEIAELTARLDRLDARIAELSGGAAPAAALPEGTPSAADDATGPDASHKDRKRANAAKTARR